MTRFHKVRKLSQVIADPPILITSEYQKKNLWLFGAKTRRRTGKGMIAVDTRTGIMKNCIRR